MVDQYLNCEDIAMNFLISHITRKPPLKVRMAVMYMYICVYIMYIHNVYALNPFKRAVES